MLQPLPIRSVNHISHVTSRLEESTTFYRDVLGFRPIQRPPFDFPGAWLYNYGVQVHLIATRKDGEAPGEISVRTDHVAFHVDDTDHVEGLLKERGIPYRTNIVPGTGIKQLFFHDPDGNHIEIGSYPPATELTEE
ncbi:MAG: glyoxalase [Planctomycetaceae bacterium]|nr:glyoxalase [Planctomycetaceae bacterium]